MPTLFLLDAYALIFRAYYAFIRAPRINSRGQNTSAVFGFVNTLEDLLQRMQPTHIGVVFDPKGDTFRHALYPDYKAQREATPEDIRWAVPYIKRIVEAYRIPILEVEGYEADDVIGTLATEAGRQGIDTYMMTPDKDYAQLVSNHVHMYRPAKGGNEAEVLGVDEVREKYGVDRPEQVVDLLGLMGDTADNIPGCPGVGEKTAVKLIQQFGSIEGLLARTNELKGALQKKVVEHTEQIRLSRTLATINTQVPIVLDMDMLVRQSPDKEALLAIYEELEFRSFIAKFQSHDTSANANATAPTTSTAGMMGDLFATAEVTAPMQGALQSNYGRHALETLADRTVNYTLITSLAACQALLPTLLAASSVSFDTETTSTDATTAGLVGMSFATQPGQAYYVAVPQDAAETSALVALFAPLWESDRVLLVGQNIKYDYTVLTRYGARITARLFDTMLAHYVLQPELRHGMDYMAETLLNYRPISIETLIGSKGKGQGSMADLSPEAICDYACEDADITLQLYHYLAPRLDETGMRMLFEQVEMPLVTVLAKMELAGVHLDTPVLAQIEADFKQRLAQLEAKVYEMAGHAFNISSPKQVGELLFDELKIADKAKKTKGGQYVTSEEVLESYKDKHPIVGLILDYRGLRKLLSTYVEALPKLIHPDTGNIHTTFNQAVTATGRLSSSDPNLQNIPVRGDDGREIRRAFAPELGQLFFSADYSQIELRIMAHLSQDPHMIAAFRAEDDIHADTAARIYHKPIEHVTSDERRKAKTANFGIIYGISAFGLSQRIGVSRGEAKALIDSYFSTYPTVKAYMEKSIAEAKAKGYAETLFGRRRYLPDLHSGNAVVRGFAERNAINTPIQGTAADIIKVAMARIHQRFEAEGIRSRMILQVHDELNFSVLPEEKTQVERIVVEEMERAYPLSVPLKAECGWGKNWLEAH